MDAKVRLAGNISILELNGRLDRSSAAQVRKAVMEATARQNAQLVINLRGVDYLDSSGLSVLVQGLKRARENLGDLCLCELQPPVRMIFELTRFDKVFEIFSCEEDAVLAAESAI